jgi:DNA-binding NarL/FixJ family response regulator
MNVLIIDDHGLFRAGLEQLLRSLDDSMSITSIACFSELDSVDLKPHSIDLVLLDYHIPGDDPLQNIRKTRELLPKSKTVLVSAETNCDTILIAIDNGISGFIPKRADPDVLIVALQLVLAGGVYLPHEVISYFQNLLPTLDKSTPALPILETLTGRQKQVLKLAINGFSNLQISKELNISIDTVKSHLGSAYGTLGVHSRTQAVLACHELGGLS